MSGLIDTHAHIYLEEFDADRTEIITRAQAAGVEAICLPNIDTTSIERMLAVEASYSFCHAAMGLHPCSVKDDFEKQLQVVEHWLNQRSFVAIGEIGTDLYWDRTHWAQQQEAFVIQLQWARQHDLPVIIHCRDSLAETIALVQQHADTRLRGVFHCFGGSVDQARQVVELGFLLGIGGVATFKNGGLDKLLPHTGLDSLVLETDSPYLAPVPYRGKRNEPSYLLHVVSRLAGILQVPVEEVQRMTTRNARKLFRI
jgi:TatD DNase family protein